MMNIAGYAMGAAWLVKLWTRQPPVAEDVSLQPKGPHPNPQALGVQLQKPNSHEFSYAPMALATFTILFLIYCLISAINARATYRGWHIFTYHKSISWLPQSYDSKASWFAFWTYLSLAIVFWVTWDWLGGGATESRIESSRVASENEGRNEGERSRQLRFNPRLKRLLWVLSLNSAAVALEGTFQRLSGTNKLLWLVEPRLEKEAQGQFGPYAYRANAAAYLNLVWPICLGFWLVLRERAAKHRIKIGQGSHSILVPAAVLIAASPFIATTRGGAMIALLNLLLMAVLLWHRGSRAGLWFRSGLVVLLLTVFAFAWAINGQELFSRFRTVISDVPGRTEIYKNAKQIAHDFPLFGTGPGSFGAMYQMYREPEQTWAGYAHNDWLEARVDLGWIGVSMIILMLIMPFIQGLGRGSKTIPNELIVSIWIALIGCLLHASIDFPFQIYSILCLFIVLCAVLFSVRRAPGLTS